MLILISALFLATGAAAVGCTSYVEPEDIRNRLLSEGYELGTSRPITNTFLNIPATMFPIGDGGERDPQIQFYVFGSIEEAREAAEGVSEDGFSYTWKTGPETSRSSGVEWVLPPTFFRSGDAIALYLGNNSCIRSAIAQLMGAPFAGVRDLSICERL